MKKKPELQIQVFRRCLESVNFDLNSKSQMDDLHKGANSELFHFARLNRQAPTHSEKILWESLRNKRLKGFKFRRQHPVSDFIADFFCFECNLIVEIDGGYHNEEQQKEYDEGRTFELDKLNVRVIRFTNEEVMTDLDFVLREIAKHLKIVR